MTDAYEQELEVGCQVVFQLQVNRLAKGTVVVSEAPDFPDCLVVQSLIGARRALVSKHLCIRI